MNIFGTIASFLIITAVLYPLYPDNLSFIVPPAIGIISSVCIGIFLNKNAKKNEHSISNINTALEKSFLQLQDNDKNVENYSKINNDNFQKLHDIVYTQNKKNQEILETFIENINEIIKYQQSILNKMNEYDKKSSKFRAEIEEKYTDVLDKNEKLIVSNGKIINNLNGQVQTTLDEMVKERKEYESKIENHFNVIKTLTDEGFEWLVNSTKSNLERIDQSLRTELKRLNHLYEMNNKKMTRGQSAIRESVEELIKEHQKKFDESLQTINELTILNQETNENINLTKDAISNLINQQHNLNAQDTELLLKLMEK
ncbi:hypothetical protein [Macrococcoides caseolyticum]|uniref:hypothetical protein n=1 Tax=Macrococcoides caseolyticum TaxID=69966 RepID=UPI003F5DF3FB